MKGFYKEVDETIELEQGDVFSSLPFLTLDSIVDCQIWTPNSPQLPRVYNE
jgi:hypothetical protein